ncbi:MAG: bifunctional (p)ppGpp synthetase/guanosine-3',5'-bis(diphosphate) 3'-pyrophosphohydrolase [Zoogloeaceae bacterium]|jgi:GTP pyrophosphokinase|nr:bifunctional (p)ppGpp synthetase/guanosine-3',5'-bis(diphosphate) 3'-pyrophosphohydrolase [Zoogloeaceae bacterium]
MVSVIHSVAAQGSDRHFLQTFSEGLQAGDVCRLEQALAFAEESYGAAELGSGENAWSHASGMALIVAGLKLDADSRLAALLFAIPAYRKDGEKEIGEQFGDGVAALVHGVSRLNRLRPITRGFMADREGGNPQETRAQVEVLRKMFLATVEDIRVVLLRLASRTQTLRFYAAAPEDELRSQVAQETLALYSPLANRLGVWELKWELEDLSFRFLHPETYKKIARMLDEKRIERELFIASATDRLKKELESLGIRAEVYGRPKHIYSIWNKMRKKSVEFSDLYDIRALRVIVDEVKDCYAALGIVHNIWTPIPKEFDDYISNPKGNRYRSLHTAVRCPDQRALEVQIRTWEMHRHAELGVAAHWRYKEGGSSAADAYDEKIAWLRQLLSWKNEVDNSDWVRHYKKAALDETLYVLTPQGKVVDLPRGATPLDFAYRVHTDLGHRCRGARVDGVLVPLNTPLQTGQQVEIITARQGAPSRDWLNATQGYIRTKGARTKVRQWFAALAQEETLAAGRAFITREVQRLGQGQNHFNVEDIARRMGYAKGDDLYVAAAKGEFPLRQFQALVRGVPLPEEIAREEEKTAVPVRAPTEEAPKGILIVGVDRLLTQLARCCKPAPPDKIEGFVTRGKGVSIHRVDCPNFQHLAALHPERVIETDWGDAQTGNLFATDIVVEANDRQGLLRDVSEIFARERINVIGVNTQSRQGQARMAFTVEVRDLEQLRRTLALIQEVGGVVGARRG